MKEDDLKNKFIECMEEIKSLSLTKGIVYPEKQKELREAIDIREHKLKDVIQEMLNIKKDNAKKEFLEMINSLIEERMNSENRNVNEFEEVFSTFDLEKLQSAVERRK